MPDTPPVSRTHWDYRANHSMVSLQTMAAYVPKKEPLDKWDVLLTLASPIPPLRQKVLYAWVRSVQKRYPLRERSNGN